MKSLNNIKKQAELLKAQVNEAELTLQGCEVDFQEEQTKTNFDALEKAREEYRKTYMLYDSCISYIANYDFYRQCEKQEREEAECRRMALAYC
jgi:hypothetical protein